MCHKSARAYHVPVASLGRIVDEEEKDHTEEAWREIVDPLSNSREDFFPGCFTLSLSPSEPFHSEIRIPA